jgi:hypothetical protein
MAQSGSNERTWILLLCCLTAVRVFIFSAAFPFFNNVDEQAHFDLVVKYSHGRIPAGLEPVSTESVHYIVLYGSPAYLGNPTNFPGGRFPPPPWTQPLPEVRETLLARTAAWQQVVNYEGAQPPFYYALAAVWWHFGQWFGFEGGRLLYWVRFLDMLLVAATVWLGFVTARMLFPEQLFLRLGVPALLAFIPQTAFYSIQNDTLSPLCFGVTFVCLVRLLRVEVPNFRLAAVSGLAVAATFSSKVGNLPLVAVALVVVLLKSWRLTKAGKLRPALPALAALVLCAVLPIAGWLVWTKHNFGDFTGTAAKIQFLNWTHKPFGEWWHHPIFTPHGLWTFVSGLMATFWQGEFLWHRQPLASPTVDMLYAIFSLAFVGLALVNLHPRSTAATESQRQALWLGFWSFIASVAFLGFLSIIYDFQDCFYPSRAHPYFTFGALIPFMLLFVYGLDRACRFTKSHWPRWLALAGLIVFMLISEIAIDWPVFPNPYNWFHL